jgi:hypothetical protein
MKLHRSGKCLFRIFVPLLLSLNILSPSESLAGSTTSQSDPSAITWASQAMTALTGGVMPHGVTLQGTVSRTNNNGQQETGSATLQSIGISNSQISVTFGSATLTETRSFGANGPGGQWIDTNGVTHQFAQHNCWTDAAWFFPAFSMLSDYANPNLVFNDLGQEQHHGATVEHLRVYRTASGMPAAPAHVLALVSVTDYYLDSQTALPLAIVFFAFADNDTGTSIPIELVFASYQRVNQAMVPYQIGKYLNGAQLFQISVTNAQVQ